MKRDLVFIGDVHLDRDDPEVNPFCRMLENVAQDAATLVLALHHVSRPEQVLAEARRVLEPGGRLLVVDMMPHDHEEYRQQMGHTWLGFSTEQISRFLDASGFSGGRVQPLPPDPEAQRPALFAATARRMDLKRSKT